MNQLGVLMISVLNVVRHFRNADISFSSPHRHDIPTHIRNGVLVNVSRHFKKNPICRPTFREKPNMLIGLGSWSN